MGAGASRASARRCRLRLFVFGLGYTALALIRRQRERFSAVAGTVRRAEKASALRAEGIEAMPFGDETRIGDGIERSDLLLASIPPDLDGDPALATFRQNIASAPHLAWIGYLSTIGVYGDQGGAWVNETSPCLPSNRRSRQRLAAEQDWLDLGRRSGQAVHIFRVAGIYGPGRNALAGLAAGTAKRIVKPGQVFNRIHVDDIAAVLGASIARPRPGAVYNVSDDEPAPPQDVVAFAAALAGVAPPPEASWDDASLSSPAASFYAENKRASNRLLKAELGVALRYPTYREGLRALRDAGEGPQAA
jgi:nucleoside-diphosphate-sugar epimerase